MNWLDVVLALILAGSVASGLTRGLARVAVGLAATVLGVLLGLWFYGAAASLFEPYASSRGVANFLGFLVVFLGVSLAGALVAKLLAMLLKWAGLTLVDRLLGGAFGLLRGILVGIVLILILVAFAAKPPPSSVAGSRLAPYVIDAAGVLAAMAPRELHDGFAQGYDKLREFWRETTRRGMRIPAERL